MPEEGISLQIFSKTKLMNKGSNLAKKPDAYVKSNVNKDQTEEEKDKLLTNYDLHRYPMIATAHGCCK